MHTRLRLAGAGHRRARVSTPKIRDEGKGPVASAGGTLKLRNYDVPLAFPGVLMSKAAVRLCLLMALFLTLAACSGSDRIQSAGADSTLDSAAPPPENTTAAEQPQAARGGNPGIKVASLPVGGNEDGSPCFQVSWSGDTIPDGVGAVITSVVFPAGTYEQESTPCSTPPCVGHALTALDTRCSLTITPVDSSATDRDRDHPVSVTVNGFAVCDDNSSAACQDFTAALLAQSANGSLTVDPPIAPAPAGSAPGPDTTTTEATNAGPGG